MERRPELLSSVMLRQNPHNVHEWHKRVKLFEGQPRKQILTFTEAVTTVDVHKARGRPVSFLLRAASHASAGFRPPVPVISPSDKHSPSSQATGKVHTLWTAFARFYERHNDLENARVIFEKATQARCRPREPCCISSGQGQHSGNVFRGKGAVPGVAGRTPRSCTLTVGGEWGRWRTGTWTTWRLCGASGRRWSCGTSSSAAHWTSCAAPPPRPSSSRAARRGRMLPLVPGWARCLTAGHTGPPTRLCLLLCCEDCPLQAVRSPRMSVMAGLVAQLSMPAHVHAGRARWRMHALQLRHRAATERRAQEAAAQERAGPVQARLYRSSRLWAFYCDLEESLGTLASTRAVYDAILDLRIATPQIVLNYAAFLQARRPAAMQPGQQMQAP